MNPAAPRSPLFSREMRFAVHAVRTAALLAEKIRTHEKIAPLTKKDQSPVTIADFAVQAYIASRLEAEFSKDPLVAEENSVEVRKKAKEEVLSEITRHVAALLPSATENKVCKWIDRGAGGTGQRFWTLDPIDGTKGFLRGDQYAVALALIEKGKVRLGVLGCPRLRFDTRGPRGVLAFAEKGKGSYWGILRPRSSRIRRLKVSNCADPSQAVLLRSMETNHTNTSRVDLLRKKLRMTKKPMLMDSLAKLAVLAAGRADVFFRLPSANEPDRTEWIWDQASGAILLEEAGGKVTDLHGRALDFSTGRKLEKNIGVLASNGRLHKRALEALDYELVSNIR